MCGRFEAGITELLLPEHAELALGEHRAAPVAAEAAVVPEQPAEAVARARDGAAARLAPGQMNNIFVEDEIFSHTGRHLLRLVCM